MDNHEIEALLSKKGIKATANRILVIKALAKMTHPVSLADLEEALDYTMDKASIFRALELFAEKDAVHEIEDGSRSVKYELCNSSPEHSISDQHVHFYCERCNETYCLESIKVPTLEIPEGFMPHSVNYMIKGLCPKCRFKKP